MENKLLSHAIILCGKGDLSDISKNIAKSFTCQNEKPPCNTCKFCIKTGKNVNPDVITIDFLDSNITVDEARKIRKDVYILPNECKRKVYIIKNGQNLNIQAQNALLKTLEEPPRYACFIIECTTEQSLLSTIRSRCSIYRFQDEKEDFDEEVFEIAKKVIISISKNDELSLIDIKIKNKSELILVISMLKRFLKDALILSENDCIDFNVCEKLIKSKNTAEIYKIYDILVKVEELCEFNVSVTNMIYYLATEVFKS